MLNLKIIYFGEKRLGRSVDPRKYRIIPTCALVIVLVIALLSLIYEVYIWIAASNLPIIEVGDTTYHKGEEGYVLAMARLKSILTGFLWTSGVVTLLFSTWLFLRIRKSRVKSTTHYGT